MDRDRFCHLNCAFAHGSQTPQPIAAKDHTELFVFGWRTVSIPRRVSTMSYD